MRDLCGAPYPSVSHIRGVAHDLIIRAACCGGKEKSAIDAADGIEFGGILVPAIQARIPTLAQRAP